MAVNQDSIINELKLRIRLLEKQNEQLAGRMEEKLLMWLVSDTINESDNPEELLKTVLERIAVLLDIPFSSCYRVHGDQLELISGFSLSDTINSDLFKIKSVGTLLESLEENPLFLSVDLIREHGVELNNSLAAQIQNVSFFPFESMYIPYGIFIFFETNPGKGSLKPISLVLQSLIHAAVEKFEKLNLLQELKELNYSFETRVKERAEELEAEYKKDHDPSAPEIKSQREPETEPEPEPPQKESQKLLNTAIQSEDLNALFLRNIGIEVRTPINGIQGFAELVRNPDIDESQKNNYIDIIKSCGKSLLKIIDDAVNYAYLKSEKIQLNRTEFAITPFLTELYDHFKVDELFKQRKNLELKLNVNVNGSTRIFADRDRLWQVMTNLAGNAIKFTKEGTIEIGCYFHEEIDSDETSHELHFFVKDTGVGIPEEVGEKVFDEFYKIEYEISKLYGGIGLGLTIARKLARLMGGDIWFNSVKGNGTEFYFSIPDAIMDPQKKGDLVMDPFQSGEFDWKDKNIMIVEDDEMSFIFLREILKNTQANILYAKDGSQAIDMVKQDPVIDLILMDIKLPGMSGYEATGIIKSIIDVPVIIQTAYAMADDQKRILETGCDDYITKPINRRKLLHSIRRIFSRSEMETDG
ncbi:MAG: response regulator [Bacteroidetes bacterium]|nr:response regulator [Bacteroidota bacterium]